MPDGKHLRYGLMDALRGLAAVWVLWCHSISGDYRHLAWGNPLFSAWAGFMERGYLGVTIFFLISAYGISWSIDHHTASAWPFLKRRMARIYPAYWVSLVLIVLEVFVIVTLGVSRHAALPAWIDVLSALPLIKIPYLSSLNPVYWTLGYEMHFYLLSALGLWLLRRRPFLVFDLFTLFVLAVRYDYISVGGFDSLFVIRYYWLDFYCGNLLYRALRRSPKSWRAYIPIAALIALAVSGRSLPTRFVLGPVLALVLWPLYRLDVALCRTKIVAMLQTLGHWTYSLFLTNVMVGPKLIGFVNRVTWMDTPLYLVVLLVGTAGSLAWAYAFYRWVERPLAEATKRWSALGSPGWQPAAGPARINVR